LPAEGEIRAASCGVIVDLPQGLVVTNNHVIEHADEIALTLTDGACTARQLDAATDIALSDFGRESDCLLSNADGVEVSDFVCDWNLIWPWRDSCLRNFRFLESVKGKEMKSHKKCVFAGGFCMARCGFRRDLPV
jgi:hypothetical protein